MLSVASLLNPVNSESRVTRPPSSPSLSRCTTVSSHGSPQPPSQSSIKKQKMTKDGAVFAKGKIKGEVNYPPFERFDEETLQEIQKFEVYPLGRIREYGIRHIPYNSEKKSFLEKTGRESFEVFQYKFKVPGDDKDYTVLWDYNVGLVRITPFFKCFQYPKTMPAKMLNQNPGLKEITHSITGGSLAAQGYWMPYTCALTICTTFCSTIAPALIPIFGPTFPSQCVPIEAPEHGRMIIPSSIIVDATTLSERYRLLYSSPNTSTNSTSTSPTTSTNGYTPKSSSTRASYSPSQSSTHSQSARASRHELPSSSTHKSYYQNQSQTRNTPPNLGRRLRLKRAFADQTQSASPYSTSTSAPSPDHENASEASSTNDSYFCATPNSSNSQIGPWGSRNMQSHSANSSINISQEKMPNPWLSAIPRSADIQMSAVGLPTLPLPLSIPTLSSNWRGPSKSTLTSTKRHISALSSHPHSPDGAGEADDEYESPSASASASPSLSLVDDKCNKGGDVKAMEGDKGEEKKAAWLLMKLSVKDGEMEIDGDRCEREEEGLEGPRVKRRRGVSL